MKPTAIAGALAASLLFGSVAIAAEPPVVLSVRKEVDAIDARTKSLKKSTIKKEVGGGQAELTLWKEKSGKLVRATVADYGDRGETVTQLYWQGGKLLFAFRTWNSDDGANLMPGPEKKKAKNHIKHWRVYFDQGKAAVVRLRTGDVATGKNKLSDSAVDKTLTLGGADARKALAEIAADANTAQKGNLSDRT